MIQRLRLLLQFGSAPFQGIEFLQLGGGGLAVDVRTGRELPQRLHGHFLPGVQH